MSSGSYQKRFVDNIDASVDQVAINRGVFSRKRDSIVRAELHGTVAARPFDSLKAIVMREFLAA